MQSHRRNVHLTCSNGQATACGQIIMGDLRSRESLDNTPPEWRCHRCCDVMASRAAWHAAKVVADSEGVDLFTVLTRD